MSNDEDLDDMKKWWEWWDNLDDLTLTGLHVLRDVVENAIDERAGSEDYYVRIPLPPDPACKLCWSCQNWINVGEKMVRFDWGPHVGKTYHKKCKP